MNHRICQLSVLSRVIGMAVEGIFGTFECFKDSDRESHLYERAIVMERKAMSGLTHPVL